MIRTEFPATEAGIEKNHYFCVALVYCYNVY